MACHDVHCWKKSLTSDWPQENFLRNGFIPPPPSYTDASSRASSYPPSPPLQSTFQQLNPNSARVILPEPLSYTQSTTSAYQFDFIDSSPSHPVISPYRKLYKESFFPLLSKNTSAPTSQDDMETDSDSEADTPYCSGVVYPISALRSTQNNQFWTISHSFLRSILYPLNDFIIFLYFCWMIW